VWGRRSRSLSVTVVACVLALSAVLATQSAVAESPPVLVEKLTGPGDPFAPGMDWRYNALAVSTDRTLGDGMRFDSAITDTPGHAKQVLPCKKEQEPQGEHTVIPTGGDWWRGSTPVTSRAGPSGPEMG
jgi:hypothetical protein